jgi:hypothetical protein
VPEQFGLNVSRLPDMNPSTRIRQAVDARCRWGILRYRCCCKRSIPVIFKGHFRVRPVYPADSMKASHYGKGGSDRCGAPRSGDTPRCSLGCPFRTWIVWPSTILLSKAAMAGPASTSVISTKANPRDRPLSRSVINLNLQMVPSGSKSERMASGVVTEFKLPTKMFFI